MAKAKKSVEERLQEIEDRLEILNLIAAHPPATDTGSSQYSASYWTEDGEFDRGAGLSGMKGKAAMGSGPTPGFREAMRQGIAHFAGLPHIALDGDKATVTSYLQIVMPNTQGEPVELSSHGTSKGFRIHRMTVNRWDLVRTEDGWKIARRRLRLLDSTDEGRAAKGDDGAVLRTKIKVCAAPAKAGAHFSASCCRRMDAGLRRQRDFSLKIAFDHIVPISHRHSREGGNPGSNSCVTLGPRFRGEDDKMNDLG